VIGAIFMAIVFLFFLEVIDQPGAMPRRQRRFPRKKELGQLGEGK